MIGDFETNYEDDMSLDEWYNQLRSEQVKDEQEILGLLDSHKEDEEE